MRPQSRRSALEVELEPLLEILARRRLAVVGQRRLEEAEPL